MNPSRKWSYETGSDRNPFRRWEPFRGVYPDPTELEFNMIYPYLLKYEFEDDDFVEEDNQQWLALKRNYNCPNLRALCIEFLHVVRESKGYDLTFVLDLFGYDFISISPRNKVKVYKKNEETAMWAIDQINTEAITRGKKYQFLSLENAVWTINRRRLLTFTVKEIDADVMEVDGGDGNTCDYDARTIRAMVGEYRYGFELLEWKFKVDHSETCPSISHLSLQCQ